MPSPRIDLRSDTVTQPSPEMRRAMADAELGDDVFGDDPTVIALEERAAELTGKEAGLFVASGTMGNLVSLMAHVPRGGEIIAEAESHTVFDEAGGHAVVVGATTRPIPAGPDGTMDPAAIQAAFRDPRDPHEPLTALVVLENTHGHSMGQPLSAAYTSHVARLAHAGLIEPDGPPAPGVPVHVDGARLWNAVVALGTPAPVLLRDVDSATFCLSKGLACPVGSVVVGTREFIWRARRARKLLGGGMRQVGVLAAAASVALEEGPKRLHVDHENAQRLAQGLAQIPRIAVRPEKVQTNIVIYDIGATGLNSNQFLQRLAKRKVLGGAVDARRVRMVTHVDVDSSDIEKALRVISEAVGAGF